MNPFDKLKSLMKPAPGLPVQKAPGAMKMGPISEQETIAFGILKKAIEDNFQNVFTQAKFVSTDSAGDNANDTAGLLMETADGIFGDLGGINPFFNVSSPLDIVLEMVKKLTGIASPTEAIQAVGLNTVTGLYAAVAPFIGCIKGTLEGVNTLYKAVDDVHKSFNAIEAKPIMVPGAPQQAIQQISMLLDRRANDGFVKGSIQVSEGIINTALTASGVASVASSAVSIASKIAVLAVIIRRRGIEYKEMLAGKLALADPKNLTPAVFSVCPLLGCYLLNASDTSSILISGLGQGRPAAGWMDQVEANKKFLDPILDKSKSFITDSVWRLEGPNIKSKAWLTDKRPWVERFWIERFGALNRGYRVIQGAKNIHGKIDTAYNAMKQPVLDHIKSDLQKLILLATTKGNA